MAGWHALMRQHAELRALIFDCAADPQLARDVALGMWWASGSGPMPAIVPSFRLVDRPRPQLGRALRPVTVLANPLGDLPGSFLEAARWSAQRALGATVVLHQDATGQALADALRSSELVVVSGHGTADGEAGARLQLADGSFGLDELLELDGEIAARAVVLSCCYGGSRASSAQARREQLGVASCLLALGVHEVLAPVTPVSDAAAAALGGELAAHWAGQADLGAAGGLGAAYSSARHAMLHGGRAAREADWERSLAQELADGRLRPLYASQPQAALARVRALSRTALHEAGEYFALYGTQATLLRA